MADALLEQPMTISLTRARTYRVNGVPTARDPAAAPDATGHADELRKRPTPYELLMNDMARVRDQAARLRDAAFNPDAEGLEVPFAGGRLQISAAAMALSRIRLDVQDEEDAAETETPATDEEPASTVGNMEMDSSLNGGNMAPDLGERVL